MLAWTLLLTLAAPAHAGQLSYEEALTRAEEINPDIAVAAAQLQAAEGSVLASRGVWDPTLGLGISQSGASEKGRFQGVAFTSDNGVWNWSANLGQTLPTGTSWSADWSNLRLNVSSEFAGIQQPASLDFESRTSLSLSQQLLKGYKMSYNLSGVRLAQANLNSSEAALNQQRQDTLSQVATAYWDLSYAVAALQTSRESLQVAEEERRVVEAMVQAGTMAPIEATRVEAAVAQAKMSLIEAENTRAAASDALSVLLGLPMGERIEPTTDAGEVPLNINLNVDDIVQRALESNAGLQVQRVAVENAELNLDNAQHAMLPTLTLSASAGLQGRVSGGGDAANPKYSEAVNDMLSGDYNNRFVGADFSMPLGMRSERGEVQSQAANLDVARARLRQQEQLLAQQVATHVRTLETARQRVQLAQLNQSLAEQTLAAEKARQSAGRAIQKDVLDAQRELESAKVEVIRAGTDYRKALVALEAIQGAL